MDTSIAMSGVQPNFLAIKAGANQMAQQQIQNNQQNALAGYVQQNGAAIMNGDPNALAGYAAYDPGAALGIRNTQQNMAFDAEQMAMKRTEVARQTAEALAANKTAADVAEVEAAHDKLQGTLTGAFQFYQSGNEAGYNNFLQQNGLDPAQYPFNNFPAIAAQVDGTLDGMKAWKDTFGAPDAPEWVDLTPSEASAMGLEYGQRNTQTGKIDGNKAASQETIYGPDGKPILTRGGSGGGGKPTEGNLTSAGYLQRMTAAERIFGDLAAQGTESIGLTDTAAVGTRFEPYKLSVPEQKLLQAQRNWVRAKLRKESGAVIGEDEMSAEIMTYFPQPGEGPEVAAQKREARKEAERQLQITSGDAAQQAGPLTDAAGGSGSPPPAVAGSPLPSDLQSIYDKYSTPSN